MKPIITAPAALYAVARRSAKDLETALSALSLMNLASSPRSEVKKQKLKEKEKKLLIETSSSNDDSSETSLPVSTLSRAETLIINARRKQVKFFVL
jgi:hypothetical protein